MRYKECMRILILIFVNKDLSSLYAHIRKRKEKMHEYFILQSVLNEQIPETLLYRAIL